MREDYTHISVILDRTGSMESIRDDVIGGYNAFIGEQRSQEGQATLTLVQFDSQDPYEVVHHFMLLSVVPPLDRTTYIPRAQTPLLDAMGCGINDLEASLSGIQPENRPGKVVFVVITDGQENASREFTREQILKMIQEREERDHWQFVFLSADLNAIRDSRSYGIQHDKAMYFAKTGRGTQAVWDNLSQEVSDYRQSKKDEIDFKGKKAD